MQMDRVEALAHPFLEAFIELKREKSKKDYCGWVGTGGMEWLIIVVIVIIIH